MKFSFKALQIGEGEVANYRSTLSAYLEVLRTVRDGGMFEVPESSINLPSDADTIGSIQALAREKASSAQTIIVVGIGGSNLGTEALYDGLRATHSLKQMFFLETVDEEYHRRLQELIRNTEKPEDLLVCVISKSGKTTETVANAGILFDCMNERFGDEGQVLSRFVVITDNGSPLWKTAEERGVTLLEIPKMVGGRFSVFSGVGLFPLASAGVDISELCRGAAEMRDFSLDGGDPAALSAIFLAHHSKNGCNIHDTFVFDEALLTLGRWYRQLLGESIGKRENNSGEEVRVGITPTVSVGSRDLHSVGQLALGGPKDKTTTFVTRESREGASSIVPKSGFFSGLVPEVQGKSTGEIMDALARGAMGAYEEAGLPFISVHFENERTDEYEFGAFMQWKMLEVMLLANLFQINAFDQGAVELYKIKTRELLDADN